MEEIIRWINPSFPLPHAQILIVDGQRTLNHRGTLFCVKSGENIDVYVSEPDAVPAQGVLHIIRITYQPPLVLRGATRRNDGSKKGLASIPFAPC